ncbi:MAG: hypothetical protein NW226_04455 [Microscillaceae bacterium]|nr:hypothetical protein [Microscillaceae bacterium]
MKKNILIGLCLYLIFYSCTQEQKQTNNATQTNTKAETNPAAEGFDLANSDPKAIQIADQVMEALGGRTAWDSTRLIIWNFFGARKLFWDKQSGDVRIEFIENDLKIILNEKSMQGKAFKDGKELSEPDSLKKYLEMGKSIWINDSYWLVMPFKLKDSGLTLKYLREDTTLDGRRAHVLGLTFKEVGDTPQNKYEVCVDQESNLVTQWSYFKEAQQDSANFTLPWLDYKKYGRIMLSGNRDKRQITEIQVLDSIPPDLFSSFKAVKL